MRARSRWPTGTLLVTGLGNYVHYGAHHQSLRLAWFSKPLGDRWELAGEYGVISYLPRPETVRLWRLRGVSGSAASLERDDPPPGSYRRPRAWMPATIAWRFTASTCSAPARPSRRPLPAAPP